MKEKEKSYEEIKQEYLKDPVAFLKNEKEMFNDSIGGPPVQKVVFIDDNEIFVKLSRNLDYFKDKGFVMYELLVGPIHSQVEEVVYISNRISLAFPKQSAQIALTPENDGICISKVILNPNMKQNLGAGTGIMLLFYMWLIKTLGDFPPMYLECAGNINWGDKIIHYPYSKQTKFFRKFGFRVIEFDKGDEKEGESNYCQMKFFPDKFDFEEVTKGLTTKMG
jgi:hypothetical protein